MSATMSLLLSSRIYSVWPFRCLNKLRFKASPCMNVWIALSTRLGFYIRFSVPFRSILFCAAHFSSFNSGKHAQCIFHKEHFKLLLNFCAPDKRTKRVFNLLFFTFSIFIISSINSILKRTLFVFCVLVLLSATGLIEQCSKWSESHKVQRR